MDKEPVILNAGDQGVVIELGNIISPDINRKVHALAKVLENKNFPEVIDLVPAYRSLLVVYQPLLISEGEISVKLAKIARSVIKTPVENINVVEIPTLYGEDYGPDLEHVAGHAGISTDEVIKIHSEAKYPVYMIGFTPGFPYLGGLSDKLALPRRNTPRTTVPAGSVGIAETQTGVYPIQSPGGWHILGRTPLRLFDPRKANPALLSAGDYAQFIPLSGKNEYVQIANRVERNNYQVIITTI